jgi:hypothetical protein
MARDFCEVKVKVIAIFKMTEFEGQAILAHRDPKFVIALLLKDSKMIYEANNSKVNFLVHQVAFFAIHSVTQLFMESKVVGEVYKLRIETEIIDGTRKYWLSLIV